MAFSRVSSPSGDLIGSRRDSATAGDMSGAWREMEVAEIDDDMPGATAGLRVGEEEGLI